MKSGYKQHGIQPIDFPVAIINWTVLLKNNLYRNKSNLISIKKGKASQAYFWWNKFWGGDVERGLLVDFSWDLLNLSLS